jgi:hypothetical protein
MTTVEIVSAIEKKDSALYQARHLLEKWDEGFDISDFYGDVTFLLLDIAEALGETHDT